MDAGPNNTWRRTARRLIAGVVLGAGVLGATSPAASAATTASFSNGVLSAFGDSADNSIAISRGLAARGVGRGTRVGLLMPNRAEWLATAFGVWRCGGVLVPLSTLARPRELGHFLESADVALLPRIQRGMRSAGFAGAYLSNEETLVANFHRALDAMMGV